MTLSVRPIDPVSRPFFAAEASGLDITKPLTQDQAASIEKAMDQYGVMVFHAQRFDDESQLAYSRNFGPLELASGDLNWGKPRRIASPLRAVCLPSRVAAPSLALSLASMIPLASASSSMRAVRRLNFSMADCGTPASSQPFSFRSMP